MCKLVCFIILVTSSSRLFAHTNDLDVLNIFTHQLISFEHILSILALAVISSKHKNVSSYLLPVLFFIALSVGYGVSFNITTIETVEKIFSLSVLFLGVLFFTGKKVAEQILPLVFVLFAVTHGIAHGLIQQVGFQISSSAVYYQASFFSYLSLIVLVLLATVGHDALKYIKGQMAFGYVLAICSSVFLLQ